jgi:hypothetical protein
MVKASTENGRRQVLNIPRRLESKEKFILGNLFYAMQSAVHDIVDINLVQARIDRQKGSLTW